MKLTYFFITCLMTIACSTRVHAQCNIDIDIKQFPDTICSGTSFTLSANVGTSGVAFTWIGPGGFNRSGQNEVVTFATAGNSGLYRVIGTKAGCPSDTDTMTVVVRIAPAKPVIKAGVPMCIGDTLIISNSQGTTPAWLKPVIWGPSGFSDTLFTSKIENASKANAGMYSAVHIDTFGCVSDTAHLTIADTGINTRPATPILSGITTICKGDTLKIFSTPAGPGEKYTWQWPYAGVGRTQNIMIPNYPDVGRDTFILTIDSLGCKSIPAIRIIEVLPTTSPTVSISANPGFFVAMYTPVTLTANIKDSSINSTYQWRKNGQDIFGEVNRTLNVVFGVNVVQGDFISVWISSKPTCTGNDTALSKFVAFTPNNIKEATNSNSLSVYPNPVSDVLTVDNIKDVESVIISTVTGKIINLPIVFTGNRLQINTTSLPHGMYIIRVDEKTTRFIKE